MISSPTREVLRLLPQVRGTRSVFAERTAAGYFVDVDAQPWLQPSLSGYSREER
jgi:hypothetical protein